MEMIESNNTHNEKSSAEVIIKPPKRLQSQAPASLELGPTATAFSVDDCGSCSGAIPLLSPLVLSPSMNEENNPMSVDQCHCDCRIHISDEKIEEEDEEGGNGETLNGNVRSLNVLWQYKAVSTCEDPACMFSFFRSQCMIDPAQ